MWGWSELEWVDRRGAVLLVANEIIRAAKQLPEVSRAAVWGRAALCLAGASCYCNRSRDSKGVAKD